MRSGWESTSDKVKEEFVRLGDFIFRPSDVDWFYLEPGQETPEGKLSDRTVVYCKGHCAFLDDNDHQLHSFLVQSFQPRVVNNFKFLGSLDSGSS